MKNGTWEGGIVIHHMYGFPCTPSLFSAHHFNSSHKMMAHPDSVCACVCVWMCNCVCVSACVYCVCPYLSNPGFIHVAKVDIDPAQARLVTARACHTWLVELQTLHWNKAETLIHMRVSATCVTDRLDSVLCSNIFNVVFLHWIK